MTPSDPRLMLRVPFRNELPLSVGRPSDSLLRKRILQRCWDVSYKTKHAISQQLHHWAFITEK